MIMGVNRVLGRLKFTPNIFPLSTQTNFIIFSYWFC
jgi:hypothetical protein